LSGQSRSRPVRTCVGCRQRAAASELLRVVAVEGQLLPDLRARLPGRGAHLHPRPDCLQAAERRKAFPRALRVPGPLDTAAVRRLLEPDPRPPSESRSARDDSSMSTRP
jgi:predicted RNA-binding protein YlxR (DUF448 family)